jgi:hypothetical protein
MAAPRKLLYQPDCEPFAWDDLVPRDEQNRYRIYRAVNATLELVGTAPDGGGWGRAVTCFSEEGEFRGHDCSVGVLDTHCTDERRGTWVVPPFASGGTASG